MSHVSQPHEPQASVSPSKDRSRSTSSAGIGAHRTGARPHGTPLTVLADLLATFLTGASIAGLAIIAARILGIDGLFTFADLNADGFDMGDVAIIAWIGGQSALLLRFVLPGLLRF